MSVDPSVIHASAAAGGDRYPFAEWRPLPENATQSKIQPTQFIFHTESGHGQTSNDASWRYWDRADITIEAHFLLDMGGNMLQAMSVFTRADNNASANARAISIETQDLGGDSVEVTPWTPEQVEQLAGLVAWLHLHPQINLRLEQCASWSAPGYGGHYLFPEWSIYKGKTCPGATRRMQIPEVIARAWAIINWQPAPIDGPPATPTAPVEREDMSTRILRSMSNPPEYAAQFIAVVDSHGVAIELQWTGSGDDPRVVERLGALRNAGVTDMPAALSDIRHCALHPKNTPEQIAAADGIYPHWSYDNFAP